MNGFLDSWVFDGDKLVLGKESRHRPQEQATKHKEASNFLVTKLWRVGIKRWVNHPVNVHILHNQDQRCDHDQVSRRALAHRGNKSKNGTANFSTKRDNVIVIHQPFDRAR
jgi:hypothetical protein